MRLISNNDCGETSIRPDIYLLSPKIYRKWPLAMFSAKRAATVKVDIYNVNSDHK
jgi:hypothetical protein